MTSDTHKFEIEDARETWTDADPASLKRLIDRAEALAVATVEEFNADPTAAYFACQPEYGCVWEWLKDEDTPTIRVYDCDGETIDKLV